MTKARTKKIPIPSRDEGQFFHQIVRILGNTIIGSLKNREMDVLAELLRVHNRYRDYTPDVKWKLVFHKDSKQEIKERLQMSRPNFDNHIASLKKKEILEGESIKSDYIITLDSSVYNLLFSFEVAQTQGTPQPQNEQEQKEPSQESEERYEQQHTKEHQEAADRGQEGDGSSARDAGGEDEQQQEAPARRIGRRSEPQGPQRRGSAPEHEQGRESDDGDDRERRPPRDHAQIGGEGSES